jgi:hypothetical protein
MTPEERDTADRVCREFLNELPGMPGASIEAKVEHFLALRGWDRQGPDFYAVLWTTFVDLARAGDLDSFYAMGTPPTASAH